MTDIQVHLDKIRSDAAECQLLGRLATDGKQQVYLKMAEHLTALVLELEKTIGTSRVPAQAVETSSAAIVPADPRPAVALAPERLSSALERPSKARPLLPWSLVAVLLGIIGILFLTHGSEKSWTSLALRSLQEVSPTFLNFSRDAATTVPTSERADSKVLSDQLNLLTARLDNIDRILGTLNGSGPVEPSKKEPLNTTGGNQGAKLLVPEERPGMNGDGQAPTVGASNAYPTNAPVVTLGPLPDRTDQVSSIPAQSRRAEPDARKPATGPNNCAQFRSYDADSGTYVTLTGRRRRCPE